MNKLTGKVAVVTGASKGIGASIAEHLAAEGASVVVNYASSKSGAEAVVKRIREKGGTALAIQADVSNHDDIKRLFAETKAAYGKLDVLVNNAGIYEFAPLESFTAEHFHKHFNLNVLGLLLTTQEAVKLIGPTGGSIINMSSIAARMPVATASVYAATKAAVDAITIALARTRSQEDTGQFAEPRDGGNGRTPCRWLGRKRLPQDIGIPDAAWPHRSTRRHCPGRGILRVRRCWVGNRSIAHPFRRPAAVSGCASMRGRGKPWFDGLTILSKVEGPCLPCFRATTGIVPTVTKKVAGKVAMITRPAAF
jgi:NADP-dependent 3-hydroxy acid dehydrogenase YdfG